MSNDSPNVFIKRGTGAILDYAVNWGDYYLGSDYIATGTCTVGAGLHYFDNSHDTEKSTIWISGGEIGETYELLNQIITNGGRICERVIYITVENA